LADGFFFIVSGDNNRKFHRSPRIHWRLSILQEVDIDGGHQYVDVQTHR